MAQYLSITAGSFGAGHDDNPTYTITADSGTVYRSGSATVEHPAGGYVFTPATASKAELTSGIKVKVDDAATQITATVDSGFQCSGNTADGSWIVLTPTPTPTPTSTRPIVNYSLRVGDIDGNSTINIGGVDYQLTVEDHIQNYNSLDVGTSFTNDAIGTTSVYSPNEEQFTITSVNATDNFGNVYQTSVSNFGQTDLGPNGFDITITGNYIQPPSGTEVIIDLDIQTSYEATYIEEIHYTNTVSNGTLVISEVNPSPASFSQTANTASFSGTDGSYYTASFAFTAITDYEWGAGDITNALTAGNPDANLNLINTTTVGATRTYFYGSEIGANDAFAELDFSGSPRWALDITNAKQVGIQWRLQGSSTWNTYKAANDPTIVSPIDISHNTTAVEIRISDHDGKYAVTESETEILGISNPYHNQEQAGEHTITLTENNDGPPVADRNLVFTIEQQAGATNPVSSNFLNVTIIQRSNA